MTNTETTYIFSVANKQLARSYAKRLSLKHKKEIKSLSLYWGANIRLLVLDGEICKKVNDVNYENASKFVLKNKLNMFYK